MIGGRGTLVLALLVAAGAAVLLLEPPPPPERPQPPDLLGEPKAVDPTQQAPPLLSFTAREITRVVLTRQGRRLEAVRAGEGWSGAERANAIPDFLDNLSQLGELMRLDDSPAALRDYGLESPQAEIELHPASGAPLVIVLGDRNPAATAAYVRIGRSGHVALAGALIVWEFDKAYRALGG
ncbi:MAG: DUF4340 domain-containing protein [Deltaproteobacteria bacterium]|nr:DUF4340 domain-containing protein [Deltaproteobacteria bacterium]